jgi:ketosteroid isomerase-like protein
MDQAVAVTLRFNDMINARDLEGLAGLMSEDHRFVDTTGHVVAGRSACLEAWRGFFAAYPTYRNVFVSVREDDGFVTLAGHSTCSDDPELAGPALWTARVADSLVTVWRVYNDTPEVRRQLGVARHRPPVSTGGAG